ncbi:MAG: DoxX family protein [Alcaligenaceae bacterium]|nr:DoxX family protein [Alcaligenaceae bacterium]MDN5937590.1 DoxX family protein [Salinisphaera sp.]
MHEELADVGKLILRLYLGLALIGHGIYKILHGIDPIMGLVMNHGLPGWVAYGVYAGEVLGPVLIILGLFSRVGAGLIVINMLFAFWMVHMQQLLTLDAHGGWALQLQGFFLFMALALGLMGSGRLAVYRD